VGIKTDQIKRKKDYLRTNQKQIKKIFQQKKTEQDRTAVFGLQDAG
jgi:hypothetical protein